MVVIAILSVLAGLIIPRFVLHGDSKIRMTKERIKEIVKALENYQLDNGFYPTTEQGLRALVEEPSIEPKHKKWRQYLDRVPLDPWRRHFIYTCFIEEHCGKDDERRKVEGPQKCYDLKSKGFDGIEGSKDDIDCWNMDAVCD